MVTKPKKHLHDACGGVLCLDLVNSIGRPAGKTGKEALAGKETLKCYEDLLLWSEQAGSLTARDARRLRRAARDAGTEPDAVLERARELREATFRSFAALAHGKKPAAADLRAINEEVATALAHARVERGPEGYAWAWERTDALDAPLWPIARSVADLLVSKDLARVKECANDGCLWLFLDTTKNRARRWCDMASCGNRAKVREHRKRKRSEGSPP